MRQTSGSEKQERVIRVLIADDCDAVLHYLLIVLEASPRIEVVGLATDGLAAVARARELLPDVVIMDVRMPKMDGLAATRCIKQASPALGVLFYSSSPDHIDVCQAAGGDGYLKKPCEPQELYSQVRRIAAKYRRQ